MYVIICRCAIGNICVTAQICVIAYICAITYEKCVGAIVQHMKKNPTNNFQKKKSTQNGHDSPRNIM